MRIGTKLGLIGLAGILTVGSLFPTSKAHAATDIYIETAAEGGSNSNDGLSPSTPVETIEEARQMVHDGVNQPADWTYNLRFGDGVFNQINPSQTLNFSRDYFTVNILGEGPEHTDLNAVMIASGPMHIQDLSSTGLDYTNGGFVIFRSGGSIENCALTENGAAQVDNNGEPVDITDCTFGNMSDNVPAIYVESTGKSGAQAFTVTGSNFDACSPAYRFGNGVIDANAGTDNMYLNCCDPIAIAPYGSGASIDLSGSYIECSEKSGEGTESPCGPGPGITNLDRLEGLVVNLQDVNFDGTLRYPPRSRFPGDTAWDLNDNGIPNYLEMNPDDDPDGDYATNVEEQSAGTDPLCALSAPPTEHMPATSGLGYAAAMGLFATAGGAAIRRRRQTYAPKEE